MLDLFIVKFISYLGCFRAILSLHEIDLVCLGVFLVVWAVVRVCELVWGVSECAAAGC